MLWEENGRRVLLHLPTVAVTIKDGWLLADLFVETEPTGRRKLQFVFFLGADDEGDGPHAGATIHTASPEAAQLAELWGPALQRAVWDGVLDVIEGSVSLAMRRHRGQPATLLGFSCSKKELHVDVEVQADGVA